MISPMLFSKSDSASLFVALALGYIVCYLANREEKRLRTLGFIIGTVIILSSSIILIGKLSLRFKTCAEAKATLIK